MPTKNPRINITLNEENLASVALLAKRRKRSLSAMAKELILRAIEPEEDMWLSEIADERLKKAGSKRISHEKAWSGKLHD